MGLLGKLANSTVKGGGKTIGETVDPKLLKRLADAIKDKETYGTWTDNAIKNASRTSKAKGQGFTLPDGVKLDADSPLRRTGIPKNDYADLPAVQKTRGVLNENPDLEDLGTAIEASYSSGPKKKLIDIGTQGGTTPKPKISKEKMVEYIKDAELKNGGKRLSKKQMAGLAAAILSGTALLTKDGADSPTPTSNTPPSGGSVGGGNSGGGGGDYVRRPSDNELDIIEQQLRKDIEEEGLDIDDKKYVSSVYADAIDQSMADRGHKTNLRSIVERAKTSDSTSDTYAKMMDVQRKSASDQLKNALGEKKLEQNKSIAEKINDFNAQREDNKLRIAREKIAAAKEIADNKNALKKREMDLLRYGKAIKDNLGVGSIEAYKANQRLIDLTQNGMDPMSAIGVVLDESGTTNLALEATKPLSDEQDVANLFNEILKKNSNINLDE